MLRHGDVETNDASAATDAGQHETTITNAHPRTATIETTITSATDKHAINARFSPAKALAVSTPGTYERAKAMAVSRESFPILEGHDGARQHTFACNSPEETSCVSLSSLKFQALLGVADYRHQGIACEIAKQ